MRPEGIDAAVDSVEGRNPISATSDFLRSKFVSSPWATEGWLRREGTDIRYSTLPHCISIAILLECGSVETILGSPKSFALPLPNPRLLRCAVRLLRDVGRHRRRAVRVRLRGQHAGWPREAEEGPGSEPTELPVAGRMSGYGFASAVCPDFQVRYDVYGHVACGTVG